ncbi:MAG TPA: RNA repair domain-containing protein [Thermoplasmata archaeon]|nr:RNA repair domain-containing protein [Thermoplasmata archaeon]
MGRTAREVLNELRWRKPGRLAEAMIWYQDRTRPEGHRVIRGSEIVDLERRYFTTAGARLPYYKVDRIECEGEILLDRGPNSRS